VYAVIGFAQGGPPSDERGMAAKRPAYRAAAERFIAVAAAGDAGALQPVLSPSVVARMRKETLRKVPGERVVPLFSEPQQAVGLSRPKAC
jgi:hypothetical protein